MADSEEIGKFLSNASRGPLGALAGIGGYLSSKRKKRKISPDTLKAVPKVGLFSDAWFAEKFQKGLGLPSAPQAPQAPPKGVLPNSVAAPITRMPKPKPKPINPFEQEGEKPYKKPRYGFDGAYNPAEVQPEFGDPFDFVESKINQNPIKRKNRQDILRAARRGASLGRSIPMYER